MVSINKSLVASAALLACGIVGVLDIAQSNGAAARVAAPSPAAIVAARFPTASEMLFAPAQASSISEAASKGDKLNAAADCTREHWPYIADECLSSERPVHPVRTITIQRQIAANASEATRIANVVMASR